MNDDDGMEVEGMSKLKNLDISADAARVLDGICTDEGLDRVGKWLEAWYSSLSRPPNRESAVGRRKILSRLAREQHVHGALFELFLNYEFRRRGAVVSIEPSVGGKTPDLLVDYQGSLYYVDALFLQEVHKSTAAEKDLVQKLDSHAINSDFRLLLSARSRLQTNIRRKDLLPIVEWLRAVERPGAAEDFVLPTYDGEYQLSVTAVPVSEGPLVAAQSLGGVQIASTLERVKKRIREKVRKYRALGAPLIVAVNTYHAPWTIVEWAISGTPTLDLLIDNAGNVMSRREGMRADGIWLGKQDGVYRKRATSLAGVWIFHFAHPDNPKPESRFYPAPDTLRTGRDGTEPLNLFPSVGGVMSSSLMQGGGALGRDGLQVSPPPVYERAAP